MSAQVLYQKTIQLYRAHKKTFITFLTVGIGTTTVYISLFTLFWKMLHFHHLIAATIAFVASALFQFFANRKVTFKIESSRTLPQLIKYLVLLMINYLISIGVLQLAVWLSAPLFMGLAVGVGITAITGYLLFKFWVFQPEPSNVENTN